MITVYWPAGHSAKEANVWRILDLAGMTNSVRLSKNYTRSGFAYIDNAKVSFKTRVDLGSTFTLELRFPNGKLSSEHIHLIHRPPLRRPRPNFPREDKYKG